MFLIFYRKKAELAGGGEEGGALENTRQEDEYESDMEEN